MTRNPTKWQRIISVPFVIIIFIFLSPFFIAHWIINLIRGKSFSSTSRSKQKT